MVSESLILVIIQVKNDLFLVLQNKKDFDNQKVISFQPQFSLHISSIV